MKRWSVFFLLFMIADCLFGQGMENIALNRACYQSGAADYDNVAHLTTDGHISTYWKSNGEANQWIYVDLGRIASVNEVVLKWGDVFPSEFMVYIATKGEPTRPLEWKAIFETTLNKNQISKLAVKQKVRYIKVCCPKNGQSYILKEFEVFGKGNPKKVSLKKSEVVANSTINLNTSDWALQQQSFVEANGAVISMSSYNPKGWIPAIVPGTVLNSYLSLGALPDPNYGDQQLMISEKFFTANFWYRTTFRVPSSFSGKHLWLNFDGINWKADIYLNGTKVGSIAGAYNNQKFDISKLVSFDNENALAVLIYKNDNPGEVTVQHLKDPDGNGGVIGLDSPTVLASIGWNWMPTIRGRNTGIVNDVFISATSEVSIEDPYITSTLFLPDTTKADIKLQTTLCNHSSSPIKGELVALVENITLKLPVELKGNETKIAILDSKQFPDLVFQNPRLWWPNGYGKQNLYSIKFEFVVDGYLSDERFVEFGIRQYSYTVENNSLRLCINGIPLVVRGGNWGMSESMLRCDSAGYDLRVKLHRDMNLNMIRNWIGMVGDDEFYQACDKYGIMIWDDFWLANPVDGPHPTDEKMFMDNVRIKIKRFRNHPSVALWCGRNEGFPPATLDAAMRLATLELDDSRYYIPHSAYKPVSGLGPYETKDPKWYFQHRGKTFHSEQGIVSPPTLESFKAMMPEEALWPISDMWGKHDWTQERVDIYLNDMSRCYGNPTSIEDFCRKAALMNMEGPKAMMESWQSSRGGGVLVWMTHPAWPSLICQTYDYYFAPTAAFFAFKKASEPVHIMWRADTETVELVNNTLHDIRNVTALVEIYDLDGNRLYNKEIKQHLKPNSALVVDSLPYPESASSKVHFVRLAMTDSNGQLLSNNFYWRSKDYQNYNDLSKIESAKVVASVTHAKMNGKNHLTVNLKNTGSSVALMTRLMLVDAKNGQRILPVDYSDNYISLIPGEERTVEVEFNESSEVANRPALVLEGWNLVREIVDVE